MIMIIIILADHRLDIAFFTFVILIHTGVIIWLYEEDTFNIGYHSIRNIDDVSHTLHIYSPPNHITKYFN